MPIQIGVQTIIPKQTVWEIKMKIVHYNDSELNGKHPVPVQSTKAYI